MDKKNYQLLNGFKILTFNLIPLTFFILTFNLKPLTFLSAADTDILQEKMKIEKEYEKRVVDIIEKIVGPNKAVVFVTADLQIVKQTIQRSAKEGTAEQATQFTGVAAKPKVLPGFESEGEPSVAATPGKEKSAGASQSIEATSIPTVLKALKVTLLLDQSIPPVKKEVVKEAITQSIKNDIGKAVFELSIKEAPFSSSSFWTPFLTPSVLVPLIFGILFLIVLMGPLHSVLQSFAKAFSESKKGGGEFTVLSKTQTESKGEQSGTGGGGGSGGVASGSSIEIKEGEGDWKRKKKEKPFEYITKENLKNLIYLIQEETPEVIALMITYLDPELSAAVIASVHADVQMQVALCIVNVKLSSEEDVYRIHEKIKQKIDFLVGGIDAFIKIIEQVDNRVRTEMLNTLEKQSPRLAKRVRENIFMFEDLANLPDLTVQFIMREVKTDQLAVALKGAGAEAVSTKVMANMSEGGRLLLKEEMDFGRPVTQQQIEEVQREIEKTVKKMEKERKIVLRQQVEEGEKKGVEIEGRLQKLDLGEEYKEQQPAGQTTQQAQSSEPGQHVGESPQRAIEYYNAGITAYSSGKIDDAIHYFQRSVEYNPNFWQAWQYLGSCLYSKGRIDEALKGYEKSLSANPSNTQLRDWLNNEKQKRAAAK
ncbi:MAG: FliG C-terminal domain-containing protein [Elusimicrobiota bacterium]